MGSRTLYLGRFVHSKSLDELETLHALFVDQAGKIVGVEKEASEDGYKAALEKLGWNLEDVVIVQSTDDQFFFPGFIGTSFRELLIARD
jgi:guanine deaminase